MIVYSYSRSCSNLALPIIQFDAAVIVLCCMYLHLASAKIGLDKIFQDQKGKGLETNFQTLLLTGSFFGP